MANDRALMFSPLCDAVSENTIGHQTAKVESSDIHVTTFLKKQLSKKDAINVAKDLKTQFFWAKEILNIKKKHQKKGRRRVKKLSGRQKRLLGLNKIDKKGLRYDDFKPIHQCWIEYMSEYLKIGDLEKKGFNGVEHGSWDEFSMNLWKADLHGAFISVIRSTCPVFIGIKGFLIMETKNTYKILSEDNITRIVPKQSCQFKLTIKNYELTFLGKNMLLKSSERANKKNKNYSHTDL